jgi:hypothetical protein
MPPVTGDIVSNLTVAIASAGVVMVGTVVGTVVGTDVGVLVERDVAVATGRGATAEAADATLAPRTSGVLDGCGIGDGVGATAPVASVELGTPARSGDTR